MTLNLNTSTKTGGSLFDPAAQAYLTRCPGSSRRPLAAPAERLASFLNPGTLHVLPPQQLEMHWPRVFALLLGLLAPVCVDASQTRKDLCGLSMHASDFPDAGTFSSIEATWTVPTIPRLWDALGWQTQNLSHGVALCCGDDCSTRIAAGFVASVPQANKNYTAIPMMLVGPYFAPYTKFDFHNMGECPVTPYCSENLVSWLTHAPLRLELTSTDRIWTRLEIRSPNRAHM